VVLELVQAEVAAVLGHGSAQRIEPRQAFQEMGFDSLAAVELRNRLAVATGEQLDATAVFDYPNPLALARHLLAGLGSGEGAPAESALTELASALSGLAATDSDRLRIAARLRALAADLESGSRAGGGSLDSERLRSASDEELLDIIGAQVGPGAALDRAAPQGGGGDA
jgi:rifamycin polyketide synthase module 4/5/6